MVFYKISSIESVAKIIADKITQHLAKGEKVLWLVTGGTAIKVQAKVSELITGQDLTNLTVILMDERYGPVGHPDSNWQKIIDSGFELPGATLIPILYGEDRKTTTQGFADSLKKYLDWADYSLGQFGIGPDGHTAGILPESQNINTEALATSYADSEATQEFTEGVYRDKDRITMTANAIAKLDEAIVVALGKKPELFDRLEQDIPIYKMPAQALKHVENFIVYNDCKGEKL